MTHSAKITTPSDRSIRIERIFDAPREQVWRAMTDRKLVAQWWGRGNRLVVERMDVERGGHWRFVEHGPDGVHGFEGRYREVVAPERIVQTFEWDGMPGHVAVETMTLEDLGDGRTKLVTIAQFHTTEERDGMLHSGMEQGMAQSHAALDGVLGSMPKDATSSVQRSRGITVRKVAFTMVPVTDVVRARRFYEETLGLVAGLAGSRGDMHWIEYDLPGGGCVAITNTSGNQPSQSAGATLALEVHDLASLVAHLREHGVALLGEPIRGPRCRMATCVDPEGNAILLHQLDRGDGSVP